MKFFQYTSTIAFLLAIATAVAFDNSCLLSKQMQPPTKGAPQTFLDDCPAWVINTTDEVWGTKPHVNATLERYFSPNFTSHGSFGTRYSGLDNLKKAVANTQRAFPDLKIYIDDVFCIGNDIDGYKTVMPDTLTGTNRGASAYGPATGKSVTYSGIAITYVQRNSVTHEWQYVAEWILHDEMSLIKQLGLEGKAKHPKSVSHPNPHCGLNMPSWGTANPSKSVKQPRVPSLTKLPVITDPESPLPLSKQIIKQMDNIISNQIDCFDWDKWSKDMLPFWTTDMVYDTNYVDAAAGLCEFLHP